MPIREFHANYANCELAVYRDANNANEMPIYKLRIIYKNRFAINMIGIDL